MGTTPRRALVAAALLCMAAAGGPAEAEVRIGVTVSATGPAASLGITERNVFEMLPRDIGGEPVSFFVLDDGSDTTAAVRNARRLIDESKVDLIIGSTTTPGSIAVAEVAAETGTPMFAMGAGEAIVRSASGERRWVFKAVHNDSLMVEAVVRHMVANGVRSVGYIGFSDATGDGYWAALKPMLDRNGIAVTTDQRYARTDSSVAGQVLRLVGGKPDAVFVAAFGSAAALPQTTLRERGYAGRIYQTHGVANADFLRLAGKSAEGTVLPIGPLLVAEQLPAGSTVKPVATRAWEAYGERFGPQTQNTFIANAYDAYLIAARAVPEALRAARPGTPEFRAALRDAIEGTRGFVGSNGIYTLSPADHVGLDLASVEMVTVQDGRWKLLPR